MWNLDVAAPLSPTPANMKRGGGDDDSNEEE